jgi:antitoxin component YwqK of YwqJK toxin-antitoxin module
MTFKQIRRVTIIFIVAISILSCKTKINQLQDNLQEGKWVRVDTLEYPYISKGRFHKGKEIGVWRYYNNDKLDRKEKYKKNKCLTKFYYPNGKVMQKGYTKLDDNKEETHWYYTGSWHYYDERGELTTIRNFEKGKIKNTQYVKDTI